MLVWQHTVKGIEGSFVKLAAEMKTAWMAGRCGWKYTFLWALLFTYDPSVFIIELRKRVQIVQTAVDSNKAKLITGQSGCKLSSPPGADPEIFERGGGPEAIIYKILVVLL